MIICTFYKRRAFLWGKTAVFSRPNLFSKLEIHIKKGSFKTSPSSSSLGLNAQQILDSEFHTSNTEEMIDLTKGLEVFVLDRETQNGLAGVVDHHTGNIDQPVSQLFDA